MRRIILTLGLLAAPLSAQVAPFNPQGVAMGHLHIMAEDPDAVRNIFFKVLGAKEVRTDQPIAMFPGVLVAVMKGKPAGPTEGSVINHLGFIVRDLDGTKSKLVAAGIQIEREMPATRQMFTQWPGGLRIEFTEDKNLDAPIKHHHIHFATTQIEEMREWYAKHFGAIPGKRGRFEAADLPGVNLTWNPAETAPVPNKGRVVDHFGFEVKDIRAFCKKLEAEGVPITVQPKVLPGLGVTIAFVVDPWGANIELTEGLTQFK